MQSTEGYMGLIQQDILIKKLLLIYCIDNMRENFNRLKHTYDGESLEKNYNDITRSLFEHFYLNNRIETTIENIQYLLQKRMFDDKFLLSLEKRLGYFLTSCRDRQESVFEILEEGRNKFESKNSNMEEFFEQSKDCFLNLINLYENYMYEEEKLTKKMVELWLEELTDYKNYYYNNSYKFLVYATRENAEKVIDIVLHKNALIYTSYITDSHTKVYDNRDYGLIYEFDENNLLFMSNSDNFTVDAPLSLNDNTFSIDKNYFSSRDRIIGASYNNSKIGRTFMPEQLIGESYNEVTLINNEYTVPKCVFVFDDAKEFAEKESKKLAELLNLKLVKLKR